jgi:alpha-L-fucosidase
MTKALLAVLISANAADAVVETCLEACPLSAKGMAKFNQTFDVGTSTAAQFCSCPSPKALRSWQQLKFGLFVHWGAYSQLGVDASWSLNWATRSWSWPKSVLGPVPATHEEMAAYRKRYWGLAKTFNPTKFDATAWAKTAKAAGMRYFIATTKHHDGFAMYNTTLRASATQEPYSVVRSSPFGRDVYGELARAMRAEGIGVGAYFSKADWHAHSMWDPSLGFPADQNANYNISANRSTQAKWDEFAAFAVGQLDELMAQYDPNILWLDGGWVGASGSVQGIGVLELAKRARATKPSLLVVNRDGGLAEDYLTPENPPPSQILSTRLLAPSPWEVCLTLGSQWAYKPDDEYKTAETVVRTLLTTVANGGSLLLDVGPMPTGELPPPALKILEEVGTWMDLNSEAIYETAPIFPYATNVSTHVPFAGDPSGLGTVEWRLTRSTTDPHVVFASALLNDNGDEQDSAHSSDSASAAAAAAAAAEAAALPWLPRDLPMPFVVDAGGGADGSWPEGTLSSVELLEGSSGGRPLEFDFGSQFTLRVRLPADATAPPCKHAAVFRLRFG